jgi:hypothetical protein
MGKDRVTDVPAQEWDGDRATHFPHDRLTIFGE